MPRTADEIKSLLIRAKNGETEAFGLVYTEYFSPIFRYIYSRVRHRAAADDLTQEVFLKCWNALSSFEVREKEPLAYFYTVARNLVIDYWRRKRPVFRDALEDVRSSEPMLENLMNQDLLGLGFAALDEEETEIVALKYFWGLESAEIGLLFDKTPEAVRQIQCRALRKMKAILGREPNE